MFNIFNVNITSIFVYMNIVLYSKALEMIHDFACHIKLNFFIIKTH